MIWWMLLCFLLFLIGFNGLYGDLMGVYGGLMGFNMDLAGFNVDLTVISWGHI